MTPGRFSFGAPAMVLFLALAIDISHANDGTGSRAMSQSRFAIDIGDSAGAELTRKARMLKTGDSIESVKSVLGEPTEDTRLIGKKGEFHARVLQYYVRRLDSNLVNEIQDRYISVYFDHTNKLSGVGYKLSAQPETR